MVSGEQAGKISTNVSTCKHTPYNFRICIKNPAIADLILCFLLLRFISYLTTSTSIHSEKPELYAELKHVEESCAAWMTGATKAMLKEEASKK